MAISKFQNGTILKVAVGSWIPHCEVTENEAGIVIAQGPMANLLDILATSLNFKYTLLQPADGHWGSQNNYGEWDGMVGMVKRNEVDIALGPFVISETRAKAVQFSKIFLIDYFRMMLARDLPKANPYGFLRTFTPAVWGSISTCFVLIVAVVVVSKLLIETNGKEKRYKVVDTILEASFGIFGLFLSQEYIRGSKIKSINIVLCCVYALSIIIIYNFSSSLTSLLAVKVSVIKIDTFQQLIDDPTYKIVMEASTVLTDAMKRGYVGIYGELNKKLLAGEIIEEPMSGLSQFTEHRVRTEHIALLSEEITCLKYTSDFFSKSGVCEYYLAEQRIFPSMFGIIGQKGSSIISSIDVVLEKVIEANLYENWLREKLPNRTTCLDKASFVHFSLEAYNMHSLWVMFAILCVGLSLSVLVFILEQLTKKFSN